MDQDLPEALRLAQSMTHRAHDSRLDREAITELRRQHAEIERLEAERDAMRAALKYVQGFERNRGGCWFDLRELVDEALMSIRSKA